MTIGITGSSGKFGQISIDILLRKGVNPNEIVAIGRDESKLEQFKSKGVKVRKADYDSYQELVNAFKGIDVLLLISSNDIAKRIKQHKDVIDAAKETGVKHILYTSMVRKNEDDKSPVAFVESAHIDTEKLIKQSGITYTILQNGLYSDTLTEFFFGPNVLKDGIFFPADQGTSNYVTRKDLVEATINIVLSHEQHQNKTYVLTGTETPTLYDAAKTLSQIAGKQLNYISPDVDTFKQAAKGFGVPPEYIDFSVAFALAIKLGEFSTTQTDLPKLLGREPESLSTYLTNYYK